MISKLKRKESAKSAGPRTKGAAMKILVATDGSRGGAAALKFAARLALRDSDSELVILTIGKPANGASVTARDEPVADLGSSFEKALEKRAAQKILDDAAKNLQRSGLQARYRFVSADRRTPIPEAISREADRLKADLVVVGSEGRDTLNEWVVGGVALRLIYVARRPVTVVRPPRRRKAS
jgi:nucleotide-binding universal stress UspA family protein